MNTMQERPSLTVQLDSETFRDYYYLKEELAAFCRQNALPCTGSKAELTERIALFLASGEVLPARSAKKKTAVISAIDVQSRIEPDFVCSEKHRAFFKAHIGKSFSFNVSFQNWLKSHAGKTYGEAIAAYYYLLEEKKRKSSHIEKQFEYNAYIRDFFADNQGMALADAIKCWNRKKRLAGHNRYERSDLAALSENSSAVTGAPYKP